MILLEKRSMDKTSPDDECSIPNTLLPAKIFLALIQWNPLSWVVMEPSTLLISGIFGL